MQANLFDANEGKGNPLRHSLNNAELLEFTQIFSPSLASQMLATLINDIPWQQEYLKIAGKLLAVPRLQCWMGDQASHYGYSGVRLTPCPWDQTVRTIQARVSELSGVQFNSALINYYRDGRDSVAWHADDETELGEEAVIASVSLGAERSFHMKEKHNSSAKKYRLTLRHGSLLVMGEKMQQHWLHQLPKVKGLQEPRINLTFRNIIAA